MIVEYAQLLSTAHYILDGVQVGYKPTHKNHPCAVWVRQSVRNYQWLYLLFMALCNEYTRRYGKVHKTAELLGPLSVCPVAAPLLPFTDPPQCMPDDCKGLDTVEAYKQYYRTHKRGMATWKTDVPAWFNIEVISNDVEARA